MQDSSHILQEQIQAAVADNAKLRLAGGASKAFYGRTIEGERLSTLSHSGIISHEPTELVITARAGTPLQELNDALARHSQQLASEPPMYTEHTTLGGAVAAGLSGPARPFRTSLADSILGCTILNGNGQLLHFGGKVMKNVAGYDVPRLMSGSLGCLGLILDVTLKVIPVTLAELSCVFTLADDQGNNFVNDLRRQGLPVTATSLHNNELIVRFNAGQKEIAGIPALLNRHYSFIQWRQLEKPTYWYDLRDHRLDFFSTGTPLWRLFTSADADVRPLRDNPGDMLTEWGGCQHWLKSDADPDTLFESMAQSNGQATLFRPSSNSPTDRIFQPLSPTLIRWHCELKKAFDPAGIFNQGRMYTEI